LAEFYISVTSEGRMAGNRFWLAGVIKRGFLGADAGNNGVRAAFRAMRRFARNHNLLL
jgi:hypothetical protein